EVAAFVELFALAGLAIAQPVFDLLGRNPELFILWRTTRLQLVALTAIVLLAVPLAALGLEWLVGLVAPRARPAVHAVLLGLGAGLVALQIVKGATPAGPGLLVAVALVTGALMTAARMRWAATATWLRVLALAPVLFGLIFLATSRVTDVVFRADAPVADVEVRRPSRVVMVTFDEFALTSLLDGAGRIDREMYPNLAALADGSTWYRNTTTVSPATTTAIPALLTGRLPGDQDDVPSTATHPDNLFTLLGGTYDLHVQEAATRLCPTSLCAPPPPRRGIHPGMRGMVVAAAQIWRRNASPERTPASLTALGAEDGFAVRTVERFTAWVRATDEPTLDHLHVLLPHFPWHYLPTGQDYNAFQDHGTGLVDTGDGRFGGLAWSNGWTAMAGRQRHIMNAQAADGALGRLITRLRETGEYDDALIVVTADHGVAFTAERTFRGVAEDTWPNIAWIPLLIKAPGQRTGAIDDRPAESIDVLPTIADHLGVDLPFEVGGPVELEEPATRLGFDHVGVPVHDAHGVLGAGR
ncbi:MAG: sulfatase-like hydrolase/transferase, partial [Actinomycetota bacterium]